MVKQITPVILSGGSGSRLWPLSRESRPKQFQSLISEYSMLQETALRITNAGQFSDPLVVCSNAHRFMVAEHLLEIDVNPLDIILEPMGRNTAPAITIAALRALESNPDAVLLVLPADHHIGDVENFNLTVARAAEATKNGQLVTFGITPDRAHTGFGYIRQGEKRDFSDNIFAVDEFVEKPNQENADEMISQSGWLWNSGIFMFGAADLIKELGYHAPELLASCRATMSKSNRDLDFFRLESSSFEHVENISIDYAVMEKSENVSVVPVNIDWSDIGSWQALWDISQKNPDGNVMLGDVICNDVQHSYLRSNGHLIVAQGVQDLIVVADDDVVLIAHKNETESIRDIVNQLKTNGFSQSWEHPGAYRPWGSYRNIDKGNRFLVKRLTIKPGGKLSLQKHEQRAEHWVVVQGTAVVTCGEDVRTFTADQSTYIPLGTVHRLENPADTPLELIEIQTGDYLGEDDIIRLEDTYGRK